MNTTQTIQALKEEVTKNKSRLTSLESINEGLKTELKATNNTAYQALHKVEELEETVQELSHHVSIIQDFVVN